MRDDVFLDDASGRPAGEVLAEMAAAIRASHGFLVTSHINPDGDAVGSEAALALALRDLGKAVRVVNSQPVPEKFERLLPGGLFEIACEPPGGGPRGLPGGELSSFDWCIVLDTSEPERTGALQGVVFAPGQKRMCLDHHRRRGASAFDQHLSSESAPATASLVLRLLDSLEVRLRSEIALCLWVGLATDTGWFRFANSSAPAFHDAARLVACGLAPELLYEEIYGSLSLVRARLLGRMLAGLQSELGGALVWSYAGRKELAELGARLEDLDGVIDYLKMVRGARVAALISENEPGACKVSLRALGDANVEQVARRFGGGGHVKAAGFRYRGPVERLRHDLCMAVTAMLGDNIRI
jgi:phosphoesterase RecJ-like protein